MRIAYVCADAGVPIFGRKGCSVHVQEMLRALQRWGAGVDVFAARVDETPSSGLESLRIHHVTPVGDGDPSSHAAAIAALNDELAALLDRAGPYDLVYERYSLWSFAAMEHAATARVFRAASVLLAVSTEVAAWLERRGVAPDRVHVIPNGVDTARFRPDVRPAVPGTLGSFTVGFVGSMKPWHGLDVLVEAFARLHGRVPDARLLLVGDGPARAAACADLSARGLGGVVHCTEAVPPLEVPGLLTSLDAAVAPYACANGFYFSPLKVYEYMAAGRAVVASRVGQLQTVIQHDVNGLLCPPGDAAALAAGLERLRSEPAVRARLGRAARATVLGNHTWDAVAARVLELAAAVEV